MTSQVQNTMRSHSLIISVSHFTQTVCFINLFIGTIFSNELLYWCIDRGNLAANSDKCVEYLLKYWSNITIKLSNHSIALLVRKNLVWKIVSKVIIHFEVLLELTLSVVSFCNGRSCGGITLISTSSLISVSLSIQYSTSLSIQNNRHSWCNYIA